MKVLIVYSSLTGNTKKIALAVQEVFAKEADLFPIEEVPLAAAYDFILVGFWVDRGMPDKKAQQFIKTLNNKKVALFATLGAYPDSEHAKKSMENAAALLDSSNQFLGSFICQGKVDPKLIEQFKNLPEGHPHAMNAERIARHAEAAKHPNEIDLMHAQEAFKEISRKLRDGVI